MPLMTARYPGTCATTGRSFPRGALIDYDRKTRRAVLVQDNDADYDSGAYLAARTRSEGLVSHVIGIGGKEYYRNKKGRCEDAPCCGCCTI